VHRRYKPARLARGTVSRRDYCRSVAGVRLRVTGDPGGASLVLGAANDNQPDPHEAIRPQRRRHLGGGATPHTGKPMRRGLGWSISSPSSFQQCGASFHLTGCCRGPATALAVRLGATAGPHIDRDGAGGLHWPHAGVDEAWRMVAGLDDWPRSRHVDPADIAVGQLNLLGKPSRTPSDSLSIEVAAR